MATLKGNKDKIERKQEWLDDCLEAKEYINQSDITKRIKITLLWSLDESIRDTRKEIDEYLENIMSGVPWSDDEINELKEYLSDKCPNDWTELDNIMNICVGKFKRPWNSIRRKAILHGMARAVRTYVY